MQLVNYFATIHVTSLSNLRKRRKSKEIKAVLKLLSLLLGEKLSKKSSNSELDTNSDQDNISKLLSKE